jgi:hypothetical protein
VRLPSVDDNSGNDNSGNNCDPNDPTCQLQDVSSTQQPPCSQNVTYQVPQQLQNAQYQQLGAAVTSVTLTANGDLAGLQIANITPLNFQGVQLPANSRLTVEAAPGGFTLDVSGTPGYLDLPTGSWYSAGINYAQFSNGQFTNVNGEVEGVSGTSLLGSMLGVNSQIQNSLNNNQDAVDAGNAISNAVDNCDFGSGGGTT